MYGAGDRRAAIVIQVAAGTQVNAVACVTQDLSGIDDRALTGPNEDAGIAAADRAG